MQSGARSEYDLGCLRRACGAAGSGGEFRRIVESQEQVATNRLVSSLEEQALLESLLESR